MNLNSDCIMEYFIIIYFSPFFLLLLLFSILPHQLSKVWFYYTHVKWNGTNFILNPSEYVLWGSDSSIFMYYWLLAYLSNKGIDSKSGNSKVQFLIPHPLFPLFSSWSPILKIHSVRSQPQGLYRSTLISRVSTIASREPETSLL